jgi:hypothetical protein
MEDEMSAQTTAGQLHPDQPVVPVGPVIAVPAPVAPKQPLMNPDAIYSFALAVVAAAGSTFTTDPKIATGIQLVSGILTAIGVAFHLDGK